MELFSLTLLYMYSTVSVWSAMGEGTVSRDQKVGDDGK